MLVDYNAIKNKTRHLIIMSDGVRYEGEWIDERVNPETIPKGLHWYHCRHADDGSWSEPSAIEPRVVVNFSGTFITTKPIKWPNELLKHIAVEDYWFERKN